MKRKRYQESGLLTLRWEQSFVKPRAAPQLYCNILEHASSAMLAVRYESGIVDLIGGRAGPMSTLRRNPYLSQPLCRLCYILLLSTLIPREEVFWFMVHPSKSKWIYWTGTLSATQ